MEMKDEATETPASAESSRCVQSYAYILINSYKESAQNEYNERKKTIKQKFEEETEKINYNYKQPHRTILYSLNSISLAKIGAVI